MCSVTGCSTAPAGPRRVELTPIGATLLTHAIAVLEQLREAERDVETLLAGGGRLAIGSFQSVSVKILPAVVGRILGESPQLDIRCTEYNNIDEVITPLQSGELDLAFVIGRDLDHVRRHRAPHAVRRSVRPDLPRRLASTAMAAGDVADLPLIGEQEGGSCQTALEQDLHDLGIEPSYVFRSNDNSAIQSMVRSGMGHSIRPYLAIEAGDPGIVVREMRPTLPPREIRIAWRTGHTLLPGGASASWRSPKRCARRCRPTATPPERACAVGGSASPSDVLGWPAAICWPPAHTDDVAAIADALVALHSSDPVTVYLSAAARMAHPSIEAVSDGAVRRSTPSFATMRCAARCG